MRNLAFLAMIAIGVSACETVPAGHVGVKVYLLGGAKGVDHEVLGVGRYWIGFNEQLFLFPVFKQNYSWTKSLNEGKPVDESISFQTKEGMEVNADIGITYHIDENKVENVFVAYRRGIEEITDTFLRNMVRDAFVSSASTVSVEQVYGVGKKDLQESVEANVREQTAPLGIVVEKIYLIGQLRLPDNVTKALNDKIAATQKAQQRENELREAEAEAKKMIAAAEGNAQAILTTAKAQAEANRVLSQSITSTLVEYERVKKLNGVMPQVTGATPLMNMTAK